MTQIVPQTGRTGQRFARLLDRLCPITDDTRFTITPAGIAALDQSASTDIPSTSSAAPSQVAPLAEVASLSTVDPSPDACPRCGARLGVVNLYCGGRGYVPYISCCQCEYQQRLDQRRILQ